MIRRFNGKAAAGARGIAAGLASTVAVACLLASGAALAQESTNPIRIIVGAPAGGTTDALAREVGRGLATQLKRPVFIENHGGAGGNIAASIVAKSEPNGDTLLMSFTSHTINATLFKKLPFDVVKDFTPITMVATFPSVLVASSTVPVNNVPELIEYAKKNPGKLNMAIGGNGSSLHMAGEQFKMMTGAKIVNVGYKGTNPAMTDLLAGHVEVMFNSSVNVLPYLKSDKIKVLGVTSAAPMPQFPGVQPIAATVKGFESKAWFGLFGPAKMSPELTQRFYAAARKVIDDPAFVKRLGTEGGAPAVMTPKQFGDFVVQDIQYWAKLVNFSGAVAE
jgi:tripartite-type tricarboxylate transporter receptor subunit TctC